MKKKLLIVFLLFNQFIFAQKPQKDTLLFNQYLTQFIKVLDTDPDSALIIINRCKPLVQQINQDYFSYRYHYESARVHHLLAEYTMGKNEAERALLYARKLKNNKYILRCNRLLFSFYHRLNDFKKATEYLPELEKYLEAGYENEVPGQMYATISAFFTDLETPDKVLFYGLKGIKMAEKYNDIKGLLACYNNVANAYSLMSQYKKAQELFEKQFEVAVKNDKKRNAQLALANICLICINSGNTKQLGQNLLKYEEYVTKNNLKLIKRDSTLYFTAKATYSYQIGDFEKSLEFMKKWERLGQDINNKADLESLYESYSEIYAAWHKYEIASYYRDKADSIRILINKQELAEYSEELRAKYELKDKEVQILRQEKALKESRNRNLVLVGFLIVLGVLGGLLFWIIRNKQHTKILETKIASQNKERQRISREMHDDLGANLTSLIYSAHLLKTQYADNKQVDKIKGLSDDISETINEIVWSLNVQQNTLEDWVFYTKGRMSEIIENSEIDFKFSIPDTIPVYTLTDEQKRNLYLVVKEAINNAIKHAKAQLIVMTINFTTVSSRGDLGIIIQIQDDGVGFSDTIKTKTGSGNGLANMKNRMEEIGGTITWKNQKGTFVEITLT
ncbi:MAG: histidine kinase [Arcicella sp.]|jgi:signal transduction histidine kinase|nr:histidine kinase [Arcicella sp.]